MKRREEMLYQINFFLQILRTFKTMLNVFQENKSKGYIVLYSRFFNILFDKLMMTKRFLTFKQYIHTYIYIPSAHFS